jgi:hypothetical protein
MDRCQFGFTARTSIEESVSRAHTSRMGILIPVYKHELSIQDFVRIRHSFPDPVEFRTEYANADNQILSPYYFLVHDIGHGEVMNLSKNAICPQELKMGVAQ